MSAILLLFVFPGCTAPGLHDGRACVSAAIEERTAYALPCHSTEYEPKMPDVVDLQDGVSEDEAVAISLWNSTAYQEALADLGLSRADLIQAGQLTNPDFSVLFPVGVKELEFTLSVPLEAMWLRPRRLAAAHIESRRVGRRLVQEGLDLIRSVRVAYADLLLATDRLRLAEKNARLRGQIAEIADARLKAASASKLEVVAARIDRLIEDQQAQRAVHDVELARQRLCFLMGVQRAEIRFEPLAPRPVPQLDRDVEELVCEALTSRPDLCAAELAVEAACQRARLARFDFLQVTALLPDANGEGEKGFEAGPGLKMTIPIFHQHQGAMARAHAEVERCRRHHATLCDTVEFEVRQAYSQFVQAEEAAQNWQEQILPAVREAVDGAERAYRAGGATLLLVLENSRQWLTSQEREAQAVADVRRAAAELERSVGRRLFDGGTEAESVPADTPPIQTSQEDSP